MNPICSVCDGKFYIHKNDKCFYEKEYEYFLDLVPYTSYRHDCQCPKCGFNDFWENAAFKKRMIYQFKKDDILHLVLPNHLPKDLVAIVKSYDFNFCMHMICQKLSQLLIDLNFSKLTGNIKDFFRNLILREKWIYNRHYFLKDTYSEFWRKCQTDEYERQFHIQPTPGVISTRFRLKHLFTE